MPDFHPDNRKEFFIGANTCSGFTFCAEEDLRALSRVYVIKGGPGTGKSTLLKTVAAKAEELGEEVTLYRCSSDPSSVDAVILPTRSLGFVDGTAPHVYEPLCPGATENIIDTGAFWSSRLLHAKKDEITALNAKKNSLYASAYRHLASAASVAREEEMLSESFYLRAKAASAIGRILGVKSRGSGFALKKKQTFAFSTEGKRRLNTLTDVSAISYTVSDFHGIFPLLMRTVISEARRRELEAWVCCDQYQRPLEVLFPEIGVAFVSDGGKKVLNCSRFADSDAYHRVRQRLRLHEELRGSLDSLAENELRDASDLHRSLESLYGETMDLPSLTLMTEAFVSDVLK